MATQAGRLAASSKARAASFGDRSSFKTAGDCPPRPAVLKLLLATGARTSMRDEASYLCDSCGEEIVVPVDLSAGSTQEYVEDCPVCCHPNAAHVGVHEDGHARVMAGSEEHKDGSRFVA